MAERRQIDWEAIEREYRAGQLSVSEIGRQQGLSHTAINKKAKAQGWTRNLTEKVRQEVSARLVSDGVSADNVRQTVELAAARGVEVVRSHRQDISSARSLVRLLMGQLVEAATSRDQTEDAMLGGVFRSMKLAQPPYNAYSVLRSEFDQWYASTAEAAGAEVYPEFTIVDLIWEDGKVAGVTPHLHTSFATAS